VNAVAPARVLDLFHPLFRRWFTEQVGMPTDAQARAWPEIAAGRHVLVTAPTGSGKTLAAFLWALQQLATGAWPGGGVRVLYVSPLKALNNDVQRNLLAPLAQLCSVFAGAGETFPEIRVCTRSGDTPQSERRRMLRRPPDILITTPESLNLLLSAPSGISLLTNLRTVILDEIHAAADSKRGVHLVTAVERLVLLSGEFQRIALSATVNPLEDMAAFIGGYRVERRGNRVQYRRRDVAIVQSPMSKRLDICVRRVPVPENEPVWPALAAEIRAIVASRRATLVFTNSRRLCERLALLLNQGEDRLLAYAHHGSLSREVREVVEQRLKRGELAAIVATNSLELGIDIGSLDQVVLVETPPSAAAALQRIGRAGHQVGAVSRGVLFPVHGRDCLEAAVVAHAVRERDIEPLRTVRCPLDVLAQVIVSMTGVQEWSLNALYDALRASAPYHELTRRQFDLVIDMLSGRYAETRLRELRAVVRVDRIDGTVRGHGAGLRLIYTSGGTIADRGYYTLRHAQTSARIGELDEEFVWESRIGDRFALGTQSWRIDRITHNDVFVVPAPHGAMDTPFWRAEARSRSFHLSERLLALLENADARLDSPEFRERLLARHGMEPEAADALIDFLARQRACTGAHLPHRRHVLIEHVTGAEHGASLTQTILHTLWGRPLNRPYAMALAQAWEDRYGETLEVFACNDCIALMTPSPVPARELIDLAPPEQMEALLRKQLEKTGYFGARFRECAGIALQLTRPAFGKRVPRWLSRIRAKKLLDAVLRYEDFPILAETWRSCLQDDFDLPALLLMLAELRDGAIQCTEITGPAPSPFAASVWWMQTNLYTYADDTPVDARASRLDDSLLREVVFSQPLRPRIAREAVARFQEKLQCTAPGYAPGSAADLLELLKERLLLPGQEWRGLLAAMQRDHGIREEALLGALAGKAIRIRFARPPHEFVAAAESWPRLQRVLDVPTAGVCIEAAGSGDVKLPGRQGKAAGDEEDSLAAWLAEWLRFYGPVEKDALAAMLPVAAGCLDSALRVLADGQTIVIDALRAGAAQAEICDAENLERLLCLARAAARPVFEPRPLRELALLLAVHQRVTAHETGRDAVEAALEPLLGYPMRAALLETEMLPARVRDYQPEHLDAIFRDTEIAWHGCGDKKVWLGFPEHRDSCVESVRETGELGALFPNVRGRFPLSELVRYSRMPSAEVTGRLWRWAWRGLVTNDSVESLRRGVETGFGPAPEAAVPASRRAAFQRWKASRPFAGNWYVLPAPLAAADALDAEERRRDCARLLLDRYGVLFRELLQWELPALRWGALFRTLRLMELAGEVIGGSFFEGVPGLQFIAPSALRRLQQGLPQDATFWINAADPASLCGLGLEGLKETLPKRLPATYLVYHGAALVLVLERCGLRVDVRVAPDDPSLVRYCDVFEHLLMRAVAPCEYLTIDRINDTPALRSPYLGALRERFQVAAEMRRVTLWRKG